VGNHISHDLARQAPRFPQRSNRADNHVWENTGLTGAPFTIAISQKEDSGMNTSSLLSGIGLVCLAGLWSGCSGNDGGPAIATGPPPAASVEDQRLPQSDQLTAAETAKVNQANAEPDPQKKPDL